jgi:hypothetical protein
MPDLITREEAKARGLKRYFTGKPCPNGHVAERYVSHKNCIECQQEKTRRKYKTPANRARRRTLYANNPAKRIRDPAHLAALRERYATEPAYRDERMASSRDTYHRLVAPELKLFDEIMTSLPPLVVVLPRLAQTEKRAWLRAKGLNLPRRKAGAKPKY